MLQPVSSSAGRFRVVVSARSTLAVVALTALCASACETKVVRLLPGAGQVSGIAGEANIDASVAMGGSLSGGGGTAGVAGGSVNGGMGGMGGMGGAAGSAGTGGAGGNTVQIVPCATTGDWQEPEHVTGLGMDERYHAGPSLSPDGLRLFYSIGFGDDEDIWVASRPDEVSPFDNPVLVTELNTDVMDGTPFLSVNGLEIWFGSERPGGVGGRDIWMAQLGLDGFLIPRDVSELNSDAVDHLPSLTADGLSIYFGSDRETAESEDIWTATRASLSVPFAEPTKLEEISTTGYDSSPNISPDGLTLYYTSNPDDVAGPDLWIATRASVDEPFGNATRLDMLNSPEQDTDPHLSPRRTELFFATSRSGGESEIWRTVRPCLDP